MANPYHIQLLNDLHHHFPEVLYNHHRFHNVSELLTYMNDVVRTNPQHQAYHYYHQQYHARYHAQEYNDLMDDSLLVPQIHRRSNVSEAMAHSIDRQLFGGRAVSNIYSDIIRRSSQPPTPVVQPVEPEPSVRVRSFVSLGGVDLTTFLTQLLQDPLQNLDNLNDVPIIPTAEHLRNNTTVKKLDEDYADNCAICQDPMVKDQDVRTINHCQHIFHMQCIDTWFQRNIHCPCCRHDIREG